jgi:DNA-binding transcriptional regulator YdaS (Cro superfamily)
MANEFEFEGEKYVRDLLTHIVICNGSQRKAAISIGISPSYLRDVLSGRKSVSLGLAAKLGLEKVTFFRKL